MRLLMGTVVLAFGVVGCAATTVWERPGTNAADAEHDFQACDYTALLYGGDGESGRLNYHTVGGAFVSGFNEALAKNNRQNEIREACMEMAGYTRARKGAVQATTVLSRPEPASKSAMSPAETREPAALPPMPAQHVETERPQRNTVPDPAELYRRSDPAAYRWINH